VWHGRCPGDTPTQHLLHLATPITRPDSVWFLPLGFRQGQCLRPTTSKDTTRIASAHLRRNRERHTRHAWEGLAGMGVSPGHLSCHRGAHRMHKVTMKLQTFLFEMVVTSCISVQYLWKYGFAKSSDNLYATCRIRGGNWKGNVSYRSRHFSAMSVQTIRTCLYQVGNLFSQWTDCRDKGVSKL